MRSITEPDTIEAAVHENSRNAAQNTPVMRSPMWAPIVSAQGVFAAPASKFTPPVIHGPFGNAQ